VVFCVIAGAVGLRFAADDSGQAALFNWALVLHVLVYMTVIALLMRYVFGPEVMDSDRLWGAAAACLVGILWCFLYALVGLQEANTLVRGEPARRR
jgi:hypothetical protein